MKKYFIIPILSILILVLIGTTACNPFGGTSQASQKVTATKGDLIIKVNGTGKTAYAEDAKLVFGIGGKVEQLSVKKNDMMAKDSVLAKLNTDSLELALSQNEAALAQAKLAETQAEVALASARFILNKTTDIYKANDEISEAQWEIKVCEMRMKEATDANDSNGAGYWRQQVGLYRLKLADKQRKLAELLAKDGYTDALTFDIMGQKYDRLIVEDIRMKDLQVKSAESTVEQAKKNTEQAAKALEYTKKQLKEAVITAPFDGIAATVDIKKGDVVPPVSVEPKTAIYLIDLNSMEINTEVDEIDIARVKTGQKAEIKFDALPENRYEGKVTAISLSPIARPQNTGVVVYEVKVNFAGSPPAEIKSGMSANVDIVTGERQGVVLVPNKAIKRNTQGKPVVEIMVNQKPEQREVTLGATDGTNTEILNGLEEGEAVIKQVKANGAGAL